MFWGTLFRAENNFWGITYGEITSTQAVIHFGVSFQGTDFDRISHTWLNCG